MTQWEILHQLLDVREKLAKTESAIRDYGADLSALAVSDCARTLYHTQLALEYYFTPEDWDESQDESPTRGDFRAARDEPKVNE